MLLSVWKPSNKLSAVRPEHIPPTACLKRNLSKLNLSFTGFCIPNQQLTNNIVGWECSNYNNHNLLSVKLHVNFGCCRILAYSAHNIFINLNSPVLYSLNTDFHRISTLLLIKLTNRLVWCWCDVVVRILRTIRVVLFSPVHTES